MSVEEIVKLMKNHDSGVTVLTFHERYGIYALVVFQTVERDKGRENENSRGDKGSEGGESETADTENTFKKSVAVTFHIASDGLDNSGE